MQYFVRFIVCFGIRDTILKRRQDNTTNKKKTNPTKTIHKGNCMQLKKFCLTALFCEEDVKMVICSYCVENFIVENTPDLCFVKKGWDKNE